jgi:hypothetical protein
MPKDCLARELAKKTPLSIAYKICYGKDKPEGKKVSGSKKVSKKKGSRKKKFQRVGYR